MPVGYLRKLSEYARTLATGYPVMVPGAVRTRELECDVVRHHITEVEAESLSKLECHERGGSRP